jgi:hypothetical protein
MELIEWLVQQISAYFQSDAFTKVPGDARSDPSCGAADAHVFPGQLANSSFLAMLITSCTYVPDAAVARLPVSRAPAHE